MSNDWCRSVLTKKLSRDEIQHKLRVCIEEARKTFPTTGCFSLDWLESVLIHADKLWYDGKLLIGIVKAYGAIYLHIDNEEKRVAGYVKETHDKKTISFHMNRNLFAELFAKERNPSTKQSGYHSGGLLCEDRLVCAMHVILHETVHLALTLCDKLGYREDRDDHGKEFRKIVRNYFGHTDPQHGLIPGYEQYHDLDTIRNKLRPGLKVQVFLDDKWTPCIVKTARKTSAKIITNDGQSVTVHPGLIRLVE